MEVLLKSLTGIWAFIILIYEGSAHITDWYLGLYSAYCCSSAHITDWYLAF